MSRVVEATEPDTLDYQFYLNRDQTKYIVHETYTNSEAVLAYNNGVVSQTVLPKIFSVSKINRFEVYGNPSKELQKVLRGFNVLTYSPFTEIRGYSKPTNKSVKLFSLGSVCQRWKKWC